MLKMLSCDTDFRSPLNQPEVVCHSTRLCLAMSSLNQLYIMLAVCPLKWLSPLSIKTDSLLPNSPSPSNSLPHFLSCAQTVAIIWSNATIMLAVWPECATHTTSGSASKIASQHIRFNASELTADIPQPPGRDAILCMFCWNSHPVTCYVLPMHL